jgi:hypothetical protein
MLRSIKHLQQCTVVAADGDAGHAEDFYFDRERWTIRYLVVDADDLRPKRHVLVPTMSIGHADWSTRTITLSLTREEVRHSPDVDTHKPMSRQHEERLHRHYRYPYYWGGPGVWGPVGNPAALAAMHLSETFAADESLPEQSRRSEPDSDSHLRSTYALIRSRVVATDGDIGQIDDLLVDDVSWTIRHVVVEDTNNWPGGRKTLVVPSSITGMRLQDSTVSVDASRQSIKNAPPYDPETLAERMPEGGQNVFP